MKTIRTLEERFSNLPNFPFEPHYINIGGVRLHYLDEGKGEIILCLHGEPTWSYLYRKMIPVLSKNYRVLAMDFIGFGRSDKFLDQKDYSLEMHCNTLTTFIEKMNLEKITLVVQDWGGIIGLRVATLIPEKFSRLVIMNTGLPTGDVGIEKRKMKEESIAKSNFKNSEIFDLTFRSYEPIGSNEAFLKWREYAKKTPDLPVGKIVKRSTLNPALVTDKIVAAYDAPFPDITYKAGAQIFPQLVPIAYEDPGAKEMRETREKLSKWTKPAFILFSDGDPITGKSRNFFRKLIPSASKEPDIIIQNAGHFLQEEKGEEIAEQIVQFVQRNSVVGKN